MQTSDNYVNRYNISLNVLNKWFRTFNIFDNKLIKSAYPGFANACKHTQPKYRISTLHPSAEKQE